ncbi:MAG: hypothetical protein OXE17_14440 [Chloroflexi bacterium]|nr:hypothetical protein [Chloroflexota bacterium]
MVKTGQRYVSPGGAEMVVTKGGDGDFSDGETPLQLKGSEASYEGVAVSADAIDMALGKRFTSTDGSVSVLVTKAGRCDLRYGGEPMELQQPKELPSSD